MDVTDQLRVDLAVYGTAVWLTRADGEMVRVHPGDIWKDSGDGLKDWLDWNERRAR